MLNSRKSSIDDTGSDDATEALDLQIALQTLTREMRRLIKGRPKRDGYIGGVPVDSEYVIFIIDTSPSMTDWGFWGRVLDKVDDALRLYPTVKGIQVLNDNGRYMFQTTRGEWMRDSTTRRRAILQKLAIWRGGSNSSPVEGITHAIRRYYDKNKKISLFVFGDDYAGRSIQRVTRIVSLSLIHI